MRLFTLESLFRFRQRQQRKEKKEKEREIERERERDSVTTTHPLMAAPAVQMCSGRYTHPTHRIHTGTHTHERTHTHTQTRTDTRPAGRTDGRTHAPTATQTHEDWCAQPRALRTPAPFPRSRPFFPSSSSSSSSSSSFSSSSFSFLFWFWFLFFFSFFSSLHGAPWDRRLERYLAVVKGITTCRKGNEKEPDNIR